MTQPITRPFWTFTQGDQPLVAVALHDGHDLRPEVANLLAMDRHQRKREEDPFTAIWTHIADTRLVVQRSRFEVDLNRPRENAIYLQPQDAWGLDLWRSPPSAQLVARSLAAYDAFYGKIEPVFADLERRFGCFVVYDLHTYNHLRGGFDAPPADQQHNPEINLGTGSLSCDWDPLVERFITDLRAFNFLGRQLDVRENVQFRGGHFSRWVHQQFPNSACVLAIEVKKFFMDEWSHKPDRIQVNAIREALHSTVPGVLECLRQC